jgi:YVTN family beta-propeller protein
MKTSEKLTSSYNNSQKFISKLLIVTMLLLDLPFFGITGSAKAETINPNNWVTIPVKPDPMMQGLNIPANAATQGMWSGVRNWPINGLHMAVLPDGAVLTYGSDLTGTLQEGHYFDVWNPTLGFGSNSHNTSGRANTVNSFCSTSTYLNNGNLLISGGNAQTASNIFSPSTRATTNEFYNYLALQRWYSTMITLPDGRPLMLGGMVTYSEGMENNPDQAIALGLPSMTPEILETNGWRSLFGATSRDAFGPDVLRTSYPRAWVAPNGRVFGVSSDKMWFLDPAGNGSIPYVGNYKRYGGSTIVNAGSTNTAVMYAPGKILIVGGNGGQNEDGRPASNQATVIDINSGTPILTEQPNMSGPRRLSNSVVLANGQVVVTGGTRRGNNNGADSVFVTEIWSPTTTNDSLGTWSTGASASIYRGYHSQTVLMPNGTILSAGGGAPGPVTNLNAEIYYPPYLFNNVNGTSQLASRPVIKAISGLSYNNNAAMQVDMESTEPISQLALVGLSQGTHNFNTGQRRIPLSFNQESFRLTTTIPNSNLTPPGYYQVVALDANGVPSLGAIIAIGQNQAPPSVPSNPYTPPDISGAINAPVLNPGGTANYSVTAVSGVTYSWNFGDGSPSTPFSPNPSVTHTFPQSGLYVVTLSARDAANIITTRTFLQAVATTKTNNSPSNSTPIIYETRAGNSSRVWVVNPDNDSVSIIDSITNTVSSTINVGLSPRTLAVAPDGRIWVANKESATISIINPTTLTVAQTISLPRASQPHGLAFAPAGGSAYVALEATGQLLKLNPNTGAQQGLVNVGNNPRHIAITADATKILVSRFITPPVPGEPNTTINITSTSNVGGEVVVVNPSSMTVTQTVILHHSDKGDSEIQGSGIPNYLGAASISPDGNSAWIPSKQDNIKRGMLRNSRQLDFQNTVRAISSRIDMGTLTEDYAKRIDHDNSSVGSAVAYHPSGVYMFVALETSRQVAVVDAIGGNELFKIEVGRAPQGLAISPDGNTLYVHEFMDRSVSIFNLSPLTSQGLLSVNQTKVEFTVGVEKLPARVVLGKQLFYDAKDPRLARDSYMSCASCHNDAGNDGRVWDLTGFGEGLRNTISLRGRAGMGHGFLHWSANFDEVHDFEKQIRDLAGGTGLMSNALFNSGTVNQPLGTPKAGLSTSLDDLAAYLNSLTTFAPSPYRNNDGSMTTDASAGRLVFNNNCSSCHSGNNFSDSANATSLKNIGTITSSSGQRLGAALTGIDVPTLRDVWATAPYLHNGSALTLSSAVQAHNNLNLNATDLSNVVAYIQQIGNQETTSSNVAPTVNLTAPTANAVFTQGTAITISANATDSDGSVTQVQFFDGATLIGTDNTAPYSMSYTGAALGARSLTAVATDDDGARTTSAAVSVTVNTVSAALTARYVRLTALSEVNGNPWASAAEVNILGANGQPLSRSGWVATASSQEVSWENAVAANTIDGNVNTIWHSAYSSGAVPHPHRLILDMRTSQVVTALTYLRRNGTPNGTIRNYEIHISNDGINWGTPIITGTMSPVAGQVTTINFPVTNTSSNVAPTVSLTAPTANAVFTQGTAITISATAADSDGTVTQVQFFDGATLIGTDTTAPYSMSLTNATVGAHSFTAVATDNAGATTTSAVVSVTVNATANVAPTVNLTAPTANAVFTQGTAITISANASR